MTAPSPRSPVPTPAYAAHARLVTPALPSAALWRLGLGVVTFLGFAMALTSAIFLGLSRSGLMPVISAEIGAPQTLGFLLTFAGALLALAIALGLVHRRSLASVIGPVPLALSQALRVAGLAVPLFALTALLPGPEGLELTPGMAPRLWLAWLVPGLLAVALQIGTEEMIFRGWLQSQLAARFRSPLVWLVLPSLVFGSLHWNPASGGNAPWIMALAAGFGLVAADLTARAGTLGPAMVLHFLNNAMAILLVGQPDLGGLALFILPLDPASPGLTAQLLVEAGFLGVLWLAARVALRR